MPKPIPQPLASMEPEELLILQDYLSQSLTREPAAIVLTDIAASLRQIAESLNRIADSNEAIAASRCQGARRLQARASRPGPAAAGSPEVGEGEVEASSKPGRGFVIGSSLSGGRGSRRLAGARRVGQVGSSRGSPSDREGSGSPRPGRFEPARP